MTIFDGDGNAVAMVTVTGIETAWTDYGEGDRADEGREYVRVTIFVESTTAEDEFGINVDHFILQDNAGSVTTAESIRTAAQVETDEEVVSEAELANGESAEMALTFEVDSNVGPQSVFYRPDDDRLIDIAEIAAS